MAYSEAHKRATLKYRQAHRQRMTLEMSPEDIALIGEVAGQTGESRTALIKRLVREEQARIKA